MAETAHLVEHWQEVGDPPPNELGSARVLVSEAAALVAGALPAEAPPDGGRTLEWMDGEQALGTDLVTTGPGPFRVAMRPCDASLLLLDHTGAVLATRPLEGATIQQAADWLAGQLRERGAELRAPEMAHRETVTPAHRGALTELSRWLENASRLLRKLAGSTADASPVRFDAARAELCTTMRLAGRSGEPERDVTVGLSCGDASVAEPYFFARPRPVDPKDDLPALPSGARWVREPVVEAVLPGSSVAVDRDPAAQADRVVAFIEAAVPAAHGLLHRSWQVRARPG